MRRTAMFLLVGALAAGAAACGGGDDDAASGDVDIGDPGDCTVVDMAVSSEKIALLTELATEFNEGEGEDAESGCVFVRPRRVASGAAANLIVDGWPNPEANGPPPVIWSPAGSAWAQIVNERSGSAIAPANGPNTDAPQPPRSAPLTGAARVM